MLALLLAFASTAFAHDGIKNVVVTDEVVVVSDQHVVTCADVVVVQQAAPAPPPEPKRQPDPFRLQGSILQAWDGSPWLAGQFRLVGRKDAYVGIEGRVSADESWTARVGLGFDLLGKSDWDLKLGLFLGGVGVGWVRDPALVTGAEVAFAARIGRLYGQYRWLAGLGASDAYALELHTEHEFIVGFRIVGQLRVFGQAVYARPGSGEGATALGLGVAFRL